MFARNKAQLPFRIRGQDFRTFGHQRLRSTRFVILNPRLAKRSFDCRQNSGIWLYLQPENLAVISRDTFVRRRPKSTGYKHNFRSRK